jgi:hypothetical protein
LTFFTNLALIDNAVLRDRLPVPSALDARLAKEIAK